MASSSPFKYAHVVRYSPKACSQSFPPSELLKGSRRLGLIN